MSPEVLWELADGTVGLQCPWDIAALPLCCTRCCCSEEPGSQCACLETLNLMDSLFPLRIQCLYSCRAFVLHLSWEPVLLALETSLPPPCLLNNAFSVLTQVVGFSLFLLINVCRSHNLLCNILTHWLCFANLTFQVIHNELLIRAFFFCIFLFFMRKLSISCNFNWNAFSFSWLYMDTWP